MIDQGVSNAEIMRRYVEAVNARDGLRRKYLKAFELDPEAQELQQEIDLCRATMGQSIIPSQYNR